MSQMNTLQNPLSEPRRQSPAAVVLILGRFGRKILRQLWPLVIVVFFQKEGNWWDYLVYFVLAMTVLSMLGSLASYWRFYFYCSDDEFIIEKGILNKTKLTVPFQRIQTINFQRNILHRLMGVVGLEIDTAGSQGKELSIAALQEEDAQRIRQFLLERKLSGEEEAENIDVEERTRSSTDNLLMQLEVGDLLKIGFGQNHLQTLGLIVATLFGLYEFLQDLLGDTLDEQAQRVGEMILNSFFLFLLVTIPLLILAAFILSLFRTVLKYYNLRFFRTGDGYRVISGLFTEQERHAALSKIQVVQAETNPLFSLFGMFSIRLKQASSAIVSNKQAIQVPGAYRQQVNAVQQNYFPEGSKGEYQLHKIDRAVIGRRMLYLGLLPSIALTLLSFSPMGWRALAWLLIIPLVWYTSRIYYRKWKVYLHPEGCRLEHGIWNTYETILQWYKIQAVAIRQTPFQRRKQLANLYLYTAAGDVRIPYLPLSKAQALENYILYKVETDRRDWM